MFACAVKAGKFLKPITDYQSYRCYMQEFYEERKRTDSFTWREYARLAGFSSPTYLKLVCEGKSSLSEAGIGKVADAMGLKGFDYVYFRYLVQFNQAKDDESRKKAFGAMQEVAKSKKIRVLDGDAYAYFESWKNPVLRELVAMMPGATPEAMAAMCWQPVSADEVCASLDLMVKLGLLQKKGRNVYVQTDKALVGNSDAIPMAVRTMHREMAALAQKSIDAFDVNDRNIMGVTMSVDREAYEQIVEELLSCRRKIASIANASRMPDQVYRLNLQLFPLTKKI